MVNSEERGQKSAHTAIYIAWVYVGVEHMQQGIRYVLAE